MKQPPLRYERLNRLTTDCIRYLIGVLLLFSSVAYSMENRAALVIGNAAYQGLPALNNPVNDAEDMAAKLSNLGFEVIHKSNVQKSFEARVSLPRERFWDFPASQNRLAHATANYCPDRPASVSLRHALVNSAQATHPSNDWTPLFVMLPLRNRSRTPINH